MGLNLINNLCKAQYKRGADSEKEMDCKSLFLRVMKLYGNEVQVGDIEVLAVEEVVAAMGRDEYAYTEVDNRIIERELQSGKWEKIETPILGCAVVMALDPLRPNTAQHLGVFIGENKFIHILEKHGVLLSRLNDRFFQRKIKGFYKWTNC